MFPTLSVAVHVLSMTSTSGDTGIPKESTNVMLAIPEPASVAVASPVFAGVVSAGASSVTSGGSVSTGGTSSTGGSATFMVSLS